eukprot:COSAG04_NODE_372_length_15668_cov_11.135975_2_plen_77_part_00
MSTAESMRWRERSSTSKMRVSTGWWRGGSSGDGGHAGEALPAAARGEAPGSVVGSPPQSSCLITTSAWEKAWSGGR